MNKRLYIFADAICRDRQQARRSMSQISSATCQESREPSSTSSRDHERAFVDIVTKNDPRIQRIVLFRDRSKATQTTAICEVARGVQIVQISSVRHRIFLSGSSRRSEYGRARSCVSIVSVTRVLFYAKIIPRDIVVSPRR